MTTSLTHPNPNLPAFPSQQTCQNAYHLRLDMWRRHPYRLAHWRRDIFPQA